MANVVELAPEENVQIQETSKIVVTNSDEGAGQYQIEQTNVPAMVKKVEVSSVQTIIVAADKVTITNIGATRLTISWQE